MPAQLRALSEEKPVKSTLYAHWLRIRNGLIANPKFQRWAADFPLTRPIARARTKALFDIVAGFVYSQILLAGVRLRIFDILAEGPQPVQTVASRIGFAPLEAERLLKALAALDLAQELPDGRFALGQLGAALRGNPSVALMIEHHAILYGDLADPVALLRGDGPSTGLSSFWDYARGADAEHVGPYSALMRETQAFIARDVLDAFPLGRFASLLDVGGGEGAFLAAAGARWPELKLMLFDLPAVAARAKSRLDADGLGARASVQGGNFFADALPRGADVISLVRVLHDHDDHHAEAILRKIQDACPAGGHILVAEPMSDTGGAQSIGYAYFGIYLSAMRSGRPRTALEIKKMLEKAGFRRTREVRTRNPALIRLIVAETPD